MKLRVLWASLICLGLVLAAGLVLYATYQPGFVYRVFIEGEDVGTVASLEEYTQVLEGLLAAEEAEIGFNLKFVEDISAVRELQFKPKTEEIDIEAAVAARVSYSTIGWAVLINGEQMLITATEADAEAVLAQVANHYTHDANNCTLVSAEVVDDVAICSMEVTPEDIWPVKESVDFLVQGAEKSDTYVVAKGDNLWSISRSVNMSQSDIEKANPCLKNSNVLQIGQVLNLVCVEPKLHVRTVEDVTRKEAIAYSSKYSYTNKLWANQAKVTTAGVAGKRTVTYRIEYDNNIEVKRKVVDSQVESQPVTRVLEQGTSKWPSAATGMFRWPLNTGNISSFFGNRSRGYHPAVDIAAPTGTPIYAAAAGTVVVSMRGSTYGNYIKIDHGNGYETLYAHASARLVSAGQWVAKGQMIGKVGSTGRSTGPHLHFEVWRQGARINPLNFFKP